MKKSNLLIGILIIGLITAIVAYKIAYKPHKTIQEQKIEYSGKASDLLPKIQIAPEKWQNNIVAIQGIITSIDKNGVMINGNTYCQFLNNKELIKTNINNTVTIKGRIIGYDDLLEELKLDQAIIYIK